MNVLIFLLCERMDNSIVHFKYARESLRLMLIQKLERTAVGDALNYYFAKPFSFVALWCRVKGHPNGAKWYDAGGVEPDMKCVDCGDCLG